MQTLSTAAAYSIPAVAPAVARDLHVNPALRDKGMTPSPAKAAKKAARKQRQGDEAGAAAALQARQGGKAAKIARHAQGARKPGDKSAKKGRSRR